MWVGIKQGDRSEMDFAPGTALPSAEGRPDPQRQALSTRPSVRPALVSTCRPFWSGAWTMAAECQPTLCLRPCPFLSVWSP